MKIFDSYINQEFNENLEQNKLLKPALFLDRDGVIIKDRHYIKSHKDVELEDYAFELINFVKSQNWLIIVITNQSGIARGILDWNSYRQITMKMIDLFEGPNPFNAIYANSELPNYPYNKWRKPSPGMIEEAKNSFPIDLKKSILIGDRLSDIQAGARSKISTSFHVLTGNGKKEREDIKKQINHKGFFIEDKNSIKVSFVNSLRDIPINIFSNFI